MKLEKIIWSAIAFSTVIYAIVVYLVVVPMTKGSFDSALRLPEVLVIYAVAAGTFLFATFYPIFPPDRPARVRMVGLLALYESCAIFGFVVSFLAHDWRVYLAPWALAIIGFLRVFPTSEPR